MSVADERKVYQDYAPSDVRDAFKHANAHSWQGVIDYLQNKGLETWHLTPGEDAHLVADMKQAIKDNVPFTDNWEQAYQELKSHRNPELVHQEEQKWLQKTKEYEQQRIKRDDQKHA